MSPLCVEILIWHYGRANQYPEWHKGTAQQDIQEDLLATDLLESDGNEPPNFYITDKGRALVEAICATPMPVQKWVAA